MVELLLAIVTMQLTMLKHLVMAPDTTIAGLHGHSWGRSWLPRMASGPAAAFQPSAWHKGTRRNAAGRRRPSPLRGTPRSQRDGNGYAMVMQLCTVNMVLVCLRLICLWCA